MIKKIITLIIVICVLGGVFWLLSQPPAGEINNPSDITTVSTESFSSSDLIFYWGDGCPHCENVEKWIEENNTDNKLKIVYKEVYDDINNQTELYNLAKQYCPQIINNGSIGVPTGFDPVSQECIQGDTPIIEFLSDKLTK